VQKGQKNQITRWLEISIVILPATSRKFEDELWEKDVEAHPKCFWHPLSLGIGLS
jgi:hypothetical protein